VVVHSLVVVQCNTPQQSRAARLIGEETAKEEVERAAVGVPTQRRR
jgi:hypothetical protein